MRLGVGWDSPQPTVCLNDYSKWKRCGRKWLLLLLLLLLFLHLFSLLFSLGLFQFCGSFCSVSCWAVSFHVVPRALSFSCLWFCFSLSCCLAGLAFRLSSDLVSFVPCFVCLLACLSFSVCLQSAATFCLCTKRLPVFVSSFVFFCNFFCVVCFRLAGEAAQFRRYLLPHHSP